MSKRIALLSLLIVLVLAGCASNPLILLSGDATINGTVTGEGFTSYSIEYAQENDSFGRESVWKDNQVNVTDSESQFEHQNVGTFRGTGVTDGNYRIRLSATAQDGTVSDYFHLIVDNVYISSPANLSDVPSDYLVIRGSVKGKSLDHFVVAYRKDGEKGWSTDGVRLPDDGERPVSDNKLAVIETQGNMDDIGYYDVRLIAYYDDGHNETEMITLMYLEEDQYEQDDTDTNATTIELGEVQERTVYPAYDDDYIAIPVEQETSYMATITHPPSFSIDYELYDQSLFQIYDMTTIIQENKTIIIWENDFDSRNNLNIYSYCGYTGMYSVKGEKYKDSDGDGSPDNIDCEPNNPNVLAPFEGIDINGNITFCSGPYSLSASMNIKESAHVKCDDTVFEGDYYSPRIFDIEGGKTITIEGCSFEGPDTAIYAVDYFGRLEDTKLTISNNSFTMEDGYQYYSYPFMAKTSELTLANNRISGYGKGIPDMHATIISNNTLINCTTGLVLGDMGDYGRVYGNEIIGSDIGIEAYTSDSLSIDGNRLMGCDVGIEGTFKEGATITSNTIDGSDTAIIVESSNNVNIDSNKLINSTTGIESKHNNYNVIIEENTIKGCDSGASITDSGIIFSENRITRNEKGVVLVDSAGNRITENNISDNSIGLYLESTAQNWTGEQNAIVGNVMYENSRFAIVNNQSSDVTINDTLFTSMDDASIEREVYHEEDDSA